MASLAFLKKPAPIDERYSIACQIQVISLPGVFFSDSTPSAPSSSRNSYESLYNLVQNGLAPYFDNITRERDVKQHTQSRRENDGRGGIAGTKKRIAELAVSLMHLQQNIEIPQLQLAFNPVVLETLKLAASQHIEPSPDLIEPPGLLEDSQFLNEITKNVNSWIRSIQSITKLSRDEACDSAAQEINFWLNMELALKDVEAQLRAPGVQLTMDILKHGKRFNTTLSFNADTGLKDATDLVQKYNLLMTDFPLDSLLTAATLGEARQGLKTIFSHLNKKLKICSYPTKRCLALVEGISGDLDVTLRRIIKGRSLMSLEYTHFQSLIYEAEAVWETWDDCMRDFVNTARELQKKRPEKFIPVKVSPRHNGTQDRLKYVSNFRHKHEQLQRTIKVVLARSHVVGELNDGQSLEKSTDANGLREFDAVKEVAEAYLTMKDIDAMNVSAEGTELWIEAEDLYNQQTLRVENSIIAQLRDLLGQARTANQMFRVFSKFNPLLVRPKVRGAIHEYQTQLLDNVKQDIQELQDRYKMQYGNSEAQMMAQVRDLPTISGSIIWVRQIERQLDNYVKKIEAVLGQDWGDHVEGEKLHQESVLFRKKLSTHHIFQSWIKDIDNRRLTISGRLFNIVRNRAAGNALELAVNFDDHVIALFKEARNLTYAGYAVPMSIAKVAKEAKRVYPFAVSLMDSVNGYLSNTKSLSPMAEVTFLLAGYQKDLQTFISRGLGLRWESFAYTYDGALIGDEARSGGPSDVTGRQETKHAEYIRLFAQSVSVLQSKTLTLSQVVGVINQELLDLRSCAFTNVAFRTHLDAIQRAIDKLNLENFANLGSWVSRLNAKVESTLLERLKLALHSWLTKFTTPDADSRRSQAHATLDETAEFHVLQEIPIPTVVIEITMQNQVINLNPPLDYARAAWLKCLEDYLHIVCSLDQINATRYQAVVTSGSPAVFKRHFNSLAEHSITELVPLYAAIDTCVAEMNQYVKEWLRYQSLWDLQQEQLFDTLDEDLNRWHQLLIELRQARSTFDTSDVTKSFGNVTFDYEQVQTKITQKYDQWQHDITQRFAEKLGNQIKDTFQAIKESRAELEIQVLEASTTAQAVSFITSVQYCKRKAAKWEPNVGIYRQGQTMLTRQRYNFPKDWLPVTQVSDEWDAFKDILDRKSRIVDEQIDALRAKITAEDRLISDRISEAIAQWSDEKPVSGTIVPDVALRILKFHQSRLEKLQANADMVTRAEEALDIPPSSRNDLKASLEEIQDFVSVWANLSTVWEGLNELRDTLWSGVQPRKIRQSLDNLVSTTKGMPSRMRQYAAFEHVQNRLRELLKCNPLLTELKSEAMKERHWLKILKQLRPQTRYSESLLTLGDVWDLQLISSESILKDILAQARGELALEDFMRQVKDKWSSYSLDLINYQNKCRLIRGWDEIFALCSEHLSQLQAMHYSPYFRQFEDDALLWEEKLNKIHALFDKWIDVQRQWVYLEGVFSGNIEIKHLLPTESHRFQNINSEFFSVMKKVYKAPSVVEVSQIPDLQKSLDRLLDLLSKIQKALGEYLERERMLFPRFYFVGDEDLLEIIGNSSDVSRVAKHFKKMFAGLAGLITSEEGTITGISSREGENVTLRTEVSLIRTPKINEWLSALEASIKTTLAELLSEAISMFGQLVSGQSIDAGAFIGYLDQYPAQIVVLAAQVVWTKLVQESLESGGNDLPAIYQSEIELLELLATTVLSDLHVMTRKKCEHLITEVVHQRDVLTHLIDVQATNSQHYLWLLQMRYVYEPAKDLMQRLHVQMANSTLAYGYEYLGVPERLVRTPLTDRCFLTLTQALCQRLGGSPYGPAGTGKTESVKALGLQLGRFTLIFCCDDTFDFQAMGRIFLGICQVGAWGCFDEFNRLEERILSAVSQQIQNIQIGLRNNSDAQKAEIELAGRRLKVNAATGIFITMNPGYAGRSNLPDNLKKLFRSVAMSKPDKDLISEVMLFSQGFKEAKQLSRQIVPFFEQCLHRLSKQAHYDFGLRALKSVLTSSGGLKRALAAQHSAKIQSEAQIIVQSIRETIAPKLISQDVDVLVTTQQDNFPNVQYIPADLQALVEAVESTASHHNYYITEQWLTKLLQVYQIQQIHHGVMMVGNSGSGKSAIWRTLLQAMQAVDGIEGVFHVIDSKVMSKEALYGSLDSTTREWTDGLFTGILRKIVDNLRGEENKRHWIVFDGDVDPEWVENLNSVLDDNKLLTLPNGERLNLPPNVRIMFEVETLRYATLATVSRCGMVWFNEDTVTPAQIMSHSLKQLRMKRFEDLEDTSSLSTSSSITVTHNFIVDVIARRLTQHDFLGQALKNAGKMAHIMTFTTIRALESLFSLLATICKKILQYNSHHPDFQFSEEQIEEYVVRKLVLAVVWAFLGDSQLQQRKDFGTYLCSLMNIDFPSSSDATSLIDFDVTLPEARWVSWQSQVPSVDVNTHSITQTDVVIPTVDTARHEDVLYSWLAEHKPLLLCGPPGSGKTMTLFSALKKLPDMEVVGLNFSSATTPELLIKTFEQYCEYKKTVSGLVLLPTQIGRWLVIFCDEINLPAPDSYGTQRVIAFLRQLVEQNGFWRTSDRSWVTLDRIQFVGACNPPTDAGRHPLGLRFLRHAPLVMVDYPGQLSLMQIYGTFNNAVMKILPPLRGQADALTRAMVDFYLRSQTRFTTQIQPHYVYSPRELTRWVRGIYEAIKPLETLSLEGLVRIWAHEALRLFQDRLVSEDERQWTAVLVHETVEKHFPIVDLESALRGPILFSNWLSKNYVTVEQEQLREFVKARLKTFCEEEMDVPLVLFNDVLEHALRIDRVFRQPQGHLILIGTSGSGKTTLSKFVAWMNGLTIFQIKVHGRYSAEDFDEDLRSVLRACGCKSQKICFIMDEANVLDSGFLERMNTLLANGEVPGLFEGDEYATLMTQCKEAAQRQGLLLDSPEELYKWFTQQIVRNLHVVFTMNPPRDGLSSRAATSPALFNRCVLNWMGDWSDQALFQVGSELTQSVDLTKANFAAPESIPISYQGLALPPTFRDAVVNAMVYVHFSMQKFNQKIQTQQGRSIHMTPRHYLEFVAQYIKLYSEKRNDLEEQQRHLNVGLDKLRTTVDTVQDLRTSLAQKKEQLERKDAQANEKLQRMISDQREAETRKAASLEIQTALEKQDRGVAERKEVVLRDLARAEPAVLEAQRSVSNIKRQHLTEVRSMANPPSGVKLALESVCTLLGHRVDNWKAIQVIVRRDDFIASIVNYDNEQQMTPPLRAKMRNEFLSMEEFTYERVNRASKACGPLVLWVEAQVNYSEILDRVGPLREEVGQLEEQALQTRAEARAIENTIGKLEKSIAMYKSEYATLISETEAIKTEMSRVQHKVERSVKLLDSLSQERSRWEVSSQSFESQTTTLVGDVLIAAAFLAYAGYYDQQLRQAMTNDWTDQLRKSGIACKMPMSITEYLSNADERLGWQQNDLPVDDLCVENAIILKHYQRYPLIIDPSGRAVEFLRKENVSRKLTVTSFLDDNFVKQLESALRFGNPILIQDAEYLDPILNHVLNKEYQKTGGRVLIQLGKQEIDFSPAFKLYLTTRDPSAKFAPDICSRTTFANFTVTQSSLQTQALNDVLKSERPEVDKRRMNLVKLQGEFTTNLRRLEKRLLQALNDSHGNILDDDNVIQTLETLKHEAADINTKMRESEGVMAEVESITVEYSAIAQACSSVYATLDTLHHINHSYRYSLKYFMDIFNTVLHQSKALASETNHVARGRIILREIFVETYRRTSLSILQKDKVTLAMLLARAAPCNMDQTTLSSVLDMKVPGEDISTNSADRQRAMAKINRMPMFRNSVGNVSEHAWDSFLSSDQAETIVPQVGDQKASAIDQRLSALLLVKMLRLDRFVPATEQLVTTVFPKDLLDASDDLRVIVDQVDCSTPIALSSTSGFDASYKVDALVERIEATCANIAMGSSESLAAADRAITSAAAAGTWVLVKNVHLAPQWLPSLEKRLGTLKPHQNFRLFLSMETSSKIPVNLIRASRMLMYERPLGIRANMKDSLSVLSDRASQAPVERGRLYFLLCFLHAVLQERLRYAPTLGWHGLWEFNDSDVSF